jgi:hypothetical protein
MRRGGSPDVRGTNEDSPTGRKVSDDMTTVEMKDLLASKLRDEGTYFKKSDISIRKIADGYKIVIKDYEHIPFILKMTKDEDFGFLTTVYADGDCFFFNDSKYEYDEFHAILTIGYYVGTRF